MMTTKKLIHLKGYSLKSNLTNLLAFTYNYHIKITPFCSSVVTKPPRFTPSLLSFTFSDEAEHSAPKWKDRSAFNAAPRSL